MSTETAWPDGVTPNSELVELLTLAQRHIRRNRERGTSPADMLEMGVNAELYCAYFTSAWYLKTLNEVAPEAAVKACEELAQILDDGSAVGELTWQHLEDLGVDPETIKPVAVTAETPATKDVDHE